MAVNPMEMMKLAGRMKIFAGQHPKTAAFIKSLPHDMIRQDSVVEISVKDPSGRQYVTNFRVTAEDMETMEIIKNSSFGKKQK